MNEHLEKVIEFSKHHPWVIAAGGGIGLIILVKSMTGSSATSSGGQPSWADRINASMAAKTLGFQHQENMAQINGQATATKLNYDYQTKALGVSAFTNIYDTNAQMQMQQQSSQQGILAWLLQFLMQMSGNNNTTGNHLTWNRQ